MIEAWRHRLAALSGRERLALGIGTAAALAILVYALLWLPWQQELSRLRAEVPEKARTLAWMEAQAPRAVALSQEAESAGSRPTGLPLLTLLERSANDAGLRDQISRMSPGEAPEQIRVWMDDADFDQWLRWLESLRGAGIRVAEANIDRSVDNRVDIRVTLQR